jgi:phage repressor protein C with HTH and peptisase S24 domain
MAKRKTAEPAPQQGLHHDDIWRAIDLLAESHGLSASGLARRAGLDPTSFNPSKRATPEGRPRWPSTESLSKILDITGESLDTIAGFIRGEQSDTGSRTMRHIPIIGCAQAGQAGFFDDAGYPAGAGWDTIEFPKLDDPSIYALEVSGDSMEPLYRDGDILIVSPNPTQLRRGDRVVVRTKRGEVMAKHLSRLSPTQITLKSLNDHFEDIPLPRKDVAWIARILWVSQ